MNCPRCSVGLLSGPNRQCNVCGLATVGVLTEETATGNLVDLPEDLGVDLPADLRGRYDVETQLGRTSRSLTYQLRNRVSGERIRLKILPILESAAAVLRAQFGTLAPRFASLRHPRLLPILEHGTGKDFCWYTTECLGGSALDAVLRDQGPMDFAQYVSVIDQLASALSDLHGRGLAHANLKPSNVFIARNRSLQVCDPRLVSVWRIDHPELAQDLWTVEGLATTDGEVRDQNALLALAFFCLTGEKRVSGRMG